MKVVCFAAVAVVGLIETTAQRLNEERALSLEAAQAGFECAVQCGTSLVASFIGEPATACWQCLDDTLKYGGQLPISYSKDMLQFKLGTGYTEGWCRAAGVDMDANPTGWIEQSDGSFSGCEESKNFPGIGHSSVQSHATVVEEMKQVPKLQNEGKIWRGNELGFIVSNELFWPEQINPRSVLLGASVEQHKVIRPILMRLFSTCDSTCEAGLLASASAFQDRNTLEVQKDVKIWVHDELFKIVFPGKTNPMESGDFVDMQTSFTTLTTISQLLPNALTQLIGGSTISQLKSLFESYRPMVEEIYGAELAGKTCGASASCVDQLTSGFIDTLLAAGGLSVPGGISTGLFVLHADVSKYGDLFQKVDLATVDPTQFFYESIRFFAPVVGFPFWTTAPDRATDESGLQMENGVRRVLNVALANKDPNAWGADAHKFRVKSLSDYHKNFVGFADFAEDPTVANGAMDRKCPGKALALKMGKTWFKAWDQKAWCTHDDTSYEEATPFSSEFTLIKGLQLGDSCSPFGASKCCQGSCKVSRSWWFIPLEYACSL